MCDWVELFFKHCISCQRCWRESTVCVRPSSPRAEIRLHSEKWARPAQTTLSSFFSFFFNNTVFLLVNWSVFASLSTPAKQHLPWSYKISIRSFPSAGLSLLHCFCSYMVASPWSLISVHTVSFGGTCLSFPWRCFWAPPHCSILLNSYPSKN